MNSSNIQLEQHPLRLAGHLHGLARFFRQLFVTPHEHSDERVEEGRVAEELARANPLSIREAAEPDDLEMETALPEGNKGLVFAKNDSGRALLQADAGVGHKAVVETSINRVEVVNKDAGLKPLHLAVEKGREEFIASMLASGAQVDARNNLDQTPLHVAALLGHRGIVKLLLAHGADVEARDSEAGAKPLHLAAENGHPKVVELLLAKGAEVDARNNLGETPLHVATLLGHGDVVGLLLDSEAETDARNHAGQTPLHVAAWVGHTDAVELLLANEAEIDAKNQSGETPLLRAASSAVAELLLANGAAISAACNLGRTALHYAAAAGQKDVVTLLLAKGADAHAQDRYSGKEPSHLAAENGHTEVVELLCQHSATE